MSSTNKFITPNIDTFINQELYEVKYLGCVIINVCSYYDFDCFKMTTKEEYKYKRVKANVILDHDEFIVVLLHKYIYPNFGRGYTCPSQILFLHKKFKAYNYRINNVIDSKALALAPGGRLEFKNNIWKYSNIDIKGAYRNIWDSSGGWFLEEPAECIVCMDKKACYTSPNCGNNIHYIACKNCIVKLSKCPYCNVQLQCVQKIYEIK